MALLNNYEKSLLAKIIMLKIGLTNGSTLTLVNLKRKILYAWQNKTIEIIEKL